MAGSALHIYGDPYQTLSPSHRRLWGLAVLVHSLILDVDSSFVSLAVQGGQLGWVGGRARAAFVGK